MHYPLLSLLIFIPLIGAGAILAMRSSDTEQKNHNARHLALWFSFVELLLASLLIFNFDGTTSAMQFTERYPWLPNFDVFYHLGVDGLSVLFVYLTALLTPICILISWKSITDRVAGFMAAFLALEAFVIGVFCALDSILFYLFWEAMLIPMFLIIGIWGGENRVYATLKFFLYTFIGSVLMLIALIYMKTQAGTFDIISLQNVTFDPHIQHWLFLAFFAAFAVKVPMWPFHTWLPDAHVQAPTAGSVILAGVLLKMGAYGFLRFNLPMLPDATATFAPYIAALSVIAIIYAALIAFAQKDIKKMIAYSSVSHMGFVTLGIFAGTQTAVEGAVLQMVNHGIVAAALFMLIGIIYERMHTRDLGRFGGVVQSMPLYAAFFLIFTLASVALPGTNSFVGEFMILAGSYTIFQTATVLACSGVVLGALYMLWLYRKMIMGEAEHDDVKNLKDLDTQEKWLFIPLIVMVFFIGISPNQTLGVMRGSVAHLTNEKAVILTVTEGAETLQNAKDKNASKNNTKAQGHH